MAKVSGVKVVKDCIKSGINHERIRIGKSECPTCHQGIAIWLFTHKTEEGELLICERHRGSIGECDFVSTPEDDDY